MAEQNDVYYLFYKIIKKNNNNNMIFFNMALIMTGRKYLLMTGHY